MTEGWGERFEPVERLAAGGAGDVWSAIDHATGDVVAVKVVRPTRATALLRFVREQGLRIEHPHVLTPLAGTALERRMLFAMRLVRGGSVATLLGDYGPLPVPYAAGLLRQLLGALGAVHAAGVIHRDVKPANLLLEPTGTRPPHLWLSDFGVALPVDAPRLTTRAMVVGTDGYLADQQRRGAEPDPAQDLYAAGVVGRELLTGLPPTEPGHTVAPPGTPAALWELVNALAHPDAARRPTAQAALARLGDPAWGWREQDIVEVFEVVDAAGHLVGAAPAASQHHVYFRETPPRSIS